jgi:hypothetical protein
VSCGQLELEIAMFEKVRNDKVASILRNPELSRSDRIRKLMKLRDDARAEQRLASEGGPIDDDGLNANLRDIEIALDRFGQDPAAEEGKGPASL